MKSKSVVLIDMDNTMNRLWETFFSYYNKFYNALLKIEREDLKNYQLTSNIPEFDLSKDYEVRQKIFSTPGFWEEIPIMDSNTVDVVEKIYNSFDTYICTTPWHEYAPCATEKIHWIQNHMPFIDIDKMIFIKNKNMIRADYIIEDSPENIIGKITPVIIDFPYNRGFMGIRAKNWNDINGVMFG